MTQQYISLIQQHESTNNNPNNNNTNNNNTNNNTNTSNESKYFDQVNYESSNIGAYSNEELFRDCERMVQQQYGFKPSSPFRDLKFHLLQEIWTNITKYIHHQVEYLKSVSINNIGRFSFITSHINTGNNGIIESKKLVFVMSESFIRDFNLKICKSYRKFVDNSIPTMEVNYFLVAQQCCTRKELVMLAIKMFRNRLGEIMSSGKKVVIDFNSLGQLKCEKRIVSDFEFVDGFKKPIKLNNQNNQTNGSIKKLNRILSRKDMKLLNKMRDEQQQQHRDQPILNTTNRSMIYSSGNPFTIIRNNRPMSSSSSQHGSSLLNSRCSNSSNSSSNSINQYARGNGVSAVRNLNHNVNTNNGQQLYEPHPPSYPRPPPSTSSSTRHQHQHIISSSNRSNSPSLSQIKLTRESLDTFNKITQSPVVLPSDYVDSQFSPSTNYGPHENGFRQPNPAAAKTVMDLAVKRFEKELESSRRNQQKELDDFYRQLIHNVCVSEELRRMKREEASNIQNTLINQIHYTGAKRQMEDRQYCNFFQDERDQDLDRNVNSLLMGFKKSKNNQQDLLSKSLPSIPSLQAMKPIQKIMNNENNPIEKGLKIPDKNELVDYYNEFN